jgi:hypothetical protein
MRTTWLEWLVGGLGFALVVSALIVNADARPRQNHHVK